MAHDVITEQPKDFKIIPTSAIPLVAIVYIGLIIAVATNRLWALDFFHVVGGGYFSDLLLDQSSER